MTVLSGMSNVEQMRDNLSYMEYFAPLSPEEQAVICRAQAELAKIESIPCTACHYCVGDCPKRIPIPQVFAAMNTVMMYDRLEAAKKNYAFRTTGRGKACDCIVCRRCEKTCPQHLPITELLKKCSAVFDA